MKILSICLVVVFAVFGFAQWVKSVVLFFTKHSTPPVNALLIIPIEKNCEQAEYILRSVAEDFKWTKHKRGSKIICIADNPDAQTEKICRTVCDEYSFMEYFESSIMCKLV